MSDRSPDHERFDGLVEGILERYYAAHPEAARTLGLHRFDGQVPDLSVAGEARRTAELAQDVKVLDAFEVARLDDDRRFDRELLLTGLRTERFERDRLRRLERDPIAWSEDLDLSGYIKRGYAPIDERAARLREHAAAIPQLLAWARERLQPPLARPIVATAVDVFQGMADFLRRDVPAALSEQGAQVETGPELGRATEAVEAFVELLRTELERATDQFAIGADLFAELLRETERIDIPLDRLIALADRDLEQNLAEARAIAARLDPDSDAHAVFDRLAKHHPTTEQLVGSTQNLLTELRDYVLVRQIISIPSDRICLVRETPRFLRWAFAMMDTAGPYESDQAESYYYVTPPEPDWPPARREEWLENFDYASLPIVSIHEAYPGHYVHFLHLRQIPSPVRRAMLSYAFVEGWAHYAEEMMLELGYGADQDELRLAQLREALVRNCRFVAALGMHTSGMTLDDATRLFMEKAFASEAAARQEAIRGTFDPGYLNYTLGKLLLTKLRRDAEREQGEAFSPCAFHDALLGLGAPPFALARQALLRSPDDEVL